MLPSDMQFYVFMQFIIHFACLFRDFSRYLKKIISSIIVTKDLHNFPFSHINPHSLSLYRSNSSVTRKNDHKMNWVTSRCKSFCHNIDLHCEKFSHDFITWPHFGTPKRYSLVDNCHCDCDTSLSLNGLQVSIEPAVNLFRLFSKTFKTARISFVNILLVHRLTPRNGQIDHSRHKLDARAW